MTMKSIFFAVAVAALVGAAIASCPNACSGHGSCGNHDRCACYANFVGGDCSEKACPYGRSGQECSGRGTCDRGAGSCECADGYSGASCQRTSCPNGCNGKGSCDTTTGMCSCAGGYSGNDCGTRLCPKGDDPLTHEVENSGDGTASQQSEVQTVTFNAGRGLGGTATLTYNDLYGQSWTTRPFNVGGDNVYRLEVSIVPGTTCGSDKCAIAFTYNGNTVNVQTHADASYAISSKTITAASLRAALLPLVAGHAANPSVGKDRGNTLYVHEHYSTTSVKIGGSISASTRLTFDIVLPIDMSNHDYNGELSTAFTAAWGATPTANTAELKLYQLGDRSAEIESALTSLPNQVIPSVTVSKVGVTDTGTNSDGANGNVYAQSYAITFNNEANSGDQNMLTCNAAPCDDNGCINRGPGVSEVRYMHHDAENYGEGINFVNQGYFIMDVGHDTSTADLSAGSIKIMWDTGAGIDSAIFALVATAGEVQTALRTITGWEAVTVELWGSKSASSLVVSHQFKVTFAAGYDDLGKSPTFYTMTAADGAYATVSPAGARARLYDQRFSNSIWLGKTTGYVECVAGTNAYTCDSFRRSHAGSGTTTIVPLAETGDVWAISNVRFGVDTTPTTVSAAAPTDHTISSNGPMVGTIVDYGTTGSDGSLGLAAAAYAYLKEGKTSVQTSDYFAVGSTVEVLGTSYDSAAYSCADKFGTNPDAAKTDEKTCNDATGDCGGGGCVWALHGHTDTAATASTSNNLYRKFRVTGHVTNEFNREFAKLNSFPANDGTINAANADKPDYNLKITSNNATVHTYKAVAAQVTVNEIQIITLGTGLDEENDDQVWKLTYKGEETENMNHMSTAAEIAEEINGFSALSGPVTVAGEETGKPTAGGGTATGFPRYAVTFHAIDGDVAQMVAVPSSGNNDVYVSTRANGWSIEAPISAGLDTMQAGGIINITAAEECTFNLASATAGYFCYDGVCGAVATGVDDNAKVQAAMNSVTDDAGNKLLDTTVTGGTSTAVKVAMPLGKSCDGLEYRINAAVTVEKVVQKNNNGKLFKITRSFLKSRAITSATPYSANTDITCGTGASECHDLLKGVDSMLISNIDGCDANAATDHYPFSRVVAVTGSTFGGAAAGNLKLDAALGGDGTGATPAKCSYQLARHVITLDSMPTSSAATVTKDLEYTSPVGSCSVSETTKGTYESYECSNRGACDGKSGLCTCYEGYSGQSCQTQTVLV